MKGMIFVESDRVTESSG